MKVMYLFNEIYFTDINHTIRMNIDALFKFTQSNTVEVVLLLATENAEHAYF